MSRCKIEEEKVWLQYHHDKLVYDMERVVRDISCHADGRLCGEDEETKCESQCVICAIADALDRSWYEIITDPTEEPERPEE